MVGLYQVWVIGENDEIIVDGKSVVASSDKAAEFQIVHQLDVDIDKVQVVSKMMFIQSLIGYDWRETS